MKTQSVLRWSSDMVSIWNRREDRVGLQLYWPSVTLSKWTFVAKLDSRFRITVGKEFYLGICILGFGVGLWILLGS